VGNYHTCANYGAGLCGGNLDQLDCSNIYTSILSCTDSAAPSCFVYARSTHIGDLETAYSYGCGANGDTVLVLATTTDAGGAAAASTSTDCQLHPLNPAFLLHYSVPLRSILCCRLGPPINQSIDQSG
jgi:hypothetical protein